MSYVPLDRLVKKKKLNLYRMTLGVAMRANELAQGAEPLIETDSNKVVTIALNEFSQEKVMYEEKEKKGRSKKSS